ncbi:hypothetical protein WDW86_13150 [Bdellovibrionota bacterium FG-2]
MPNRNGEVHSDASETQRSRSESDALPFKQSLVLIEAKGLKFGGDAESADEIWKLFNEQVALARSEGFVGLRILSDLQEFEFSFVF